MLGIDLADRWAERRLLHVEKRSVTTSSHLAPALKAYARASVLRPDLNVACRSVVCASARLACNCVARNSLPSAATTSAIGT
jgi:hypothetical protein